MTTHLVGNGHPSHDTSIFCDTEHKSVYAYCSAAAETELEGLATTEGQLAEICAFAEAQGWLVVATYQDIGIAGSRGRDGLDAMVTDVDADGEKGAIIMITQESRDSVERLLEMGCHFIVVGSMGARR